MPLAGRVKNYMRLGARDLRSDAVFVSGLVFVPSVEKSLSEGKSGSTIMPKTEGLRSVFVCDFSYCIPSIYVVKHTLDQT